MIPFISIVAILLSVLLLLTTVNFATAEETKLTYTVLPINMYIKDVVLEINFDYSLVWPENDNKANYTIAFHDYFPFKHTVPSIITTSSSQDAFSTVIYRRNNSTRTVPLAIMRPDEGKRPTTLRHTLITMEPITKDVTFTVTWGQYSLTGIISPVSYASLGLSYSFTNSTHQPPNEERSTTGYDYNVFTFGLLNLTQPLVAGKYYFTNNLGFNQSFVQSDKEPRSNECSFKSGVQEDSPVVATVHAEGVPFLTANNSALFFVLSSTIEKGSDIFFSCSSWVMLSQVTVFNPYDFSFLNENKSLVTNYRDTHDHYIVADLTSRKYPGPKDDTTGYDDQDGQDDKKKPKKRNIARILIISALVLLFISAICGAISFFLQHRAAKKRNDPLLRTDIEDNVNSW